MAKIFGVLLIVLGVWIGMEIYTKGMDEAFGGVFARWSAPIEPAETPDFDPSNDAAASAPSERDGRVTTGQRGSVAQRVGVKVQSNIDAGARRDGVESGDGDSDAEDNN